MRENSDLWREWPLERLEHEYSPSVCVPSIAPFLEEYVRRSHEAATRLPYERNARWGAGDDEVFDFFPAASPQAPLLIFFHGGYWQEHSKTDVLFVASGCLANGIAYASVEYTLAPRATVAEIVEQCRRAVGSISGQARTLGFDARRVFVAGSSAGAHLAAMLLVEGWQKSRGLAEDIVAGAILLSGIYDLQPLVPTYVNQALHMTEKEAAVLSPVRHPLSPAIPVIVAWGENETGEFKRQSEEFASKLKGAGFPVKSLQVAGANHFDIVFEIADPNTVLGRATLDLIAADTDVGR
jgi:arylformamidase